MLCEQLGDPCRESGISRSRIGQAVHFLRETVEIMQRLISFVTREQLLRTVPMRRKDHNTLGLRQFLSQFLQEAGVLIILQGKQRRTVCDKQGR
ncbi:hypothetical protein D3C71_1497240 [compost metagenome]